VSPQPYVPLTDDQVWERALRWLAQHNEGPLHSKQPREAPAGFVRLTYLDQTMPGGQGPNYIYIRPEWVRQLHVEPVSEPRPMWNGGPMHRDGPWVGFIVPGSGGSKDTIGTAHIAPESVEVLRAAGVREPEPAPQQAALL
jgi:hypothetical protein